MIDHPSSFGNQPEGGESAEGRPRSKPASPRSATPRRSRIDDLYADLFEPQVLPSSSASTDGTESRPSGSPPRTPKVPPPPSPSSLKEAGLGLMQVCDLLLKQLYLHGSLLGYDLAQQMRLPFSVVEEPLRFLKDEKCVEVASGEVIGSVSYRFQLTELGRARAREAFEQCRYVGPAPVPLEAYIRQCRRQDVRGTPCTMEALKAAFGDLIVKPELLEELGPAVCSGRSIFIYGPPGNGKTMLAKGLGRFLNTFGGEIYVPYAIHTEGHIVTLFDPTIHHTTDDAELPAGLSGKPTAFDDASSLYHDSGSDLRWRRIRRPVVITGGELVLEMLDLRYNRTSGFYTAPLHIKANGGVFLIDDFGRQIVSPRDLLNRWILPLEERIDYLTLATGKKFAVPFEQLIVFSTNLDPRELVDEAFLRRIRHKIHVGPPDRSLFTEIFRLCCRQREIPFDPAVIDVLYANYYEKGKPPRASDPRDLLEIVLALCRFRNQPPQLSERLISEAAQRFFCRL